MATHGEEPAILVVGADGVIGRRLVPFLRKHGRRVIATTRRTDDPQPGCVRLDLLDQDSFIIPDGVDRAVVLAAAADYQRCETDPLAARLNLEGVPQLIGRLLAAGIFTVFTSSVTVFGGFDAYPDEDAPHRPTIAYARQKSEGEKIINTVAAATGTSAGLAIVRITKSFDSQTRPVPDWLRNWRLGMEVTPFRDLYFSPMTLPQLCAGLTTAIEKRLGGVYHLSGAESLDYAEFCRRLARRLRVPDSLVRPILAEQAGVILPFKPSYGAALAMQRTRAFLGVAPQPVDEVIEQLACEAETEGGWD